MTHDRAYYRSLSARALLVLAVEEGINPEMAVAIAEELAEEAGLPRMVGKFHFVTEADHGAH